MHRSPDDRSVSRAPYAESRVRSATRLAVSEWFADRLTAGYLLAEEAGEARVDTLLRALLLDDRDTAVTEVTAEALLRRRDQAGLVLVLEVWRDADDHTGQHLADALQNVCGVDADGTDWRGELLEVRGSHPSLAGVVEEVLDRLGFNPAD